MPIVAPRVLLVDDHRVVAEGIRQLLAPEYNVVAVLTSGDQLLKAAVADRPDVIVADIAMPGLSGLEALRRMRTAGLTVPVIFLTMHAEPMMAREALRTDARGYVLKTAAGEDLLRAIRDVLQGGTYVSPALLPGVIEASQMPALTPRQRTVLDLLACGLRSRDIASQLNLSVRTVEAHRQILMELFEVNNSVSLVQRATRLGIITTR